MRECGGGFVVGVISRSLQRKDKKMKCAYCGKERPESEMYEEEITFRTRVNGRATLGHKKGYCKETKCGGKDQMAHEG